MLIERHQRPNDSVLGQYRPTQAGDQMITMVELPSVVAGIRQDFRPKLTLCAKMVNVSFTQNFGQPRSTNDQEVSLSRGQVGTVIEARDQDVVIVEFGGMDGVAYALASIASTHLLRLHHDKPFP